MPSNDNRDTVSIRHNNCAVRERCVRCRRPLKPDVGPWPFLNGDYGAPICSGCMEDISPAIYQWWRTQRDVFLLRMKRARGDLQDTLTLPSFDSE